MEHIIPYAYAAVDAVSFGKVVDPIVDNIVLPIIKLLFGIAVLVFAYGIAKMIIKADDAEAREHGKNSMIYGIVGIFIMISAWGIVYLVANTIKGI